MAVGLCLHRQPCPLALRSPAGTLETVQRASSCCRHVSDAKFTRQHRPKRSASCTTRCLQNSTVELEDIDPLTGAVLTPVRSKVPKYEGSQSVDWARDTAPSVVYIVLHICRENVTANGIRWAYRSNMEEAKDLDKDKRPVLLLHGLGSASFSYRQVPSLLDMDFFCHCVADKMGCLTTGKHAKCLARKALELWQLTGLGMVLLTR